MFWKVKSQLNSAEYEKIWKQVIELNARVDELANKQNIQ
jgi:outer membrane murein-binding lipoprotein Lpp